MAKVKQRLITTPETLEVIEFLHAIDKDNPLILNPFGRNGSVINDLPGPLKVKKKLENREKTIRRASAKLWRLYNANSNQYKETDKFLTLTFADCISDVTLGDIQLQNFFKRLKYYTGCSFEYLGARELQERQALHYHICLFGMPYVPHKKLLEIWCHNNPYMKPGVLSGVNIKGIKEGMDEVANYLTTYQLKDLLDNMDWLAGKKTIIKSRGLKLPMISEYEKIEFIFSPEDIKKGVSFIDSQVTYYRIK